MKAWDRKVPRRNKNLGKISMLKSVTRLVKNMRVFIKTTDGVSSKVGVIDSGKVMTGYGDWKSFKLWALKSLHFIIWDFYNLQSFEDLKSPIPPFRF